MMKHVDSSYSWCWCLWLFRILPIVMQLINCQSSFDEQLYSRQMLVYGQSAQQRLLDSQVLIIGNGSLAEEIVKNLALAGIGKLCISGNKCDGGLSITGECESLVDYARSLNPHIKVVDAGLSANISETNVTAVIYAGIGMKAMAEQNKLCRKSNIIQICCDVVGVCGFVFNDFLDSFEVLDGDGEIQTVIPLLKAELVALDEKAKAGGGEEVDEGRRNQHLTMKKEGIVKLTCIEEEKLNCGENDIIELDVTGASGSGIESDSFTLQVHKVLTARDILVKFPSRDDSTDFVERINGGYSTLRKSKRSFSVSHSSLEDQYESPHCQPTNECSSPKKDNALRRCLLAAFRTLEKYRSRGGDGNDREVAGEGVAGTAKNAAATVTVTVEEFESAMLEELQAMGVVRPLAPIRDKGVGEELFHAVASKFLQSCASRCPATVSVIGAIAAQEVVKACTHVLHPLTQMLLFESLDSLPAAPQSPLDQGPSRASSFPILRDDRDFSAGAGTSAVYGKEIASELQSLRLLVVGAGAIGCELLKILALLEVGQRAQDDDDDDSESRRHRSAPLGVLRDESSDGRREGGIVVTDMDHIEKSNLNRQLLFRQHHVGLSKSEVAAQQVLTINPHTLLKPLTARMDSSTASQSVFSHSFWKSVDIVLTALDNVEARRFVDSQCVTHHCWLLDSGTLGTKGNTQVIIPSVSESYSSSSDPPEDALPLCTLKSFPYMPEHCVSWARSLFDELFLSRTRILERCLSVAVPSSSSSPIPVAAVLEKELEQLSEDEAKQVLADLEGTSSGHVTPRQALQWSLQLFHALFETAIRDLLIAHPADEMVTDEEGGGLTPFWGGSRRLPTVTSFDAGDPVHRNFVLFASQLWGRSRREGDGGWDRERLVEELEGLLIGNSEGEGEGGGSSLRPSTAGTVRDSLLQRIGALDASTRGEILQSLTTQEFEKDRPELGHVDFVQAAANLRCSVYGLPSVTKLETQRIAGRIVPAVATTTALVSGLVGLELVKVAAERVAARRKRRGSDRRDDKEEGEGQLEEGSHIDAVSDSEKERLLAKFRNSFVNLARPMLAFAQPLRAEVFTNPTAAADDGTAAAPRSFTIWDIIQAPLPLKSLTVSYLELFLKKSYGAILQSVTFEDTLLFADFLPDADSSKELPLHQILVSGLHGAKAGADAADDDEDTDHRSNSRSSDKNNHFTLDNLNFIDLEVSCVDGEGLDVRLPAVRVYVSDEDCPKNTFLEDVNKENSKKSGSSYFNRMKSIWSQTRKGLSKLSSTNY